MITGISFVYYLYNIVSDFVVSHLNNQLTFCCMKIIVSDILESKIAAFHNEGLQIFSMLEQQFKQHERVELSFEGIERCSTQFLNASIGKMYLLYNPESVDGILLINPGALSNLLSKVEEVKENAILSKEDSLFAGA